MSEEIKIEDLNDAQIRALVEESTLPDNSKDAQVGVAGVFLSRSITVGSPGAGPGVDVGGEYTVFVGVNRATGKKVIAYYMGLVVDIGVDAVSIGPIGVGEEVGVFYFDGDEHAMGGASVGFELSAGIVGVSTSVSLSSGDVMFMAGASFSLGAGVEAGTTYYVEADGIAIYRSGTIGPNNIFHQAAGDSYDTAIRTAIDTGSIINGEGQYYTSIFLTMPDGFTVERQLQITGGAWDYDEESKAYTLTYRDIVRDEEGNILTGAERRAVYPETQSIVRMTVFETNFRDPIEIHQAVSYTIKSSANGSDLPTEPAADFGSIVDYEHSNLESPELYRAADLLRENNDAVITIFYEMPDGVVIHRILTVSKLENGTLHLSYTDTVVGRNGEVLDGPAAARYSPHPQGHLDFDVSSILPSEGFNSSHLGYTRQYERCFGAGTPISMWDGSEKLIEDVVRGDEILSYTKWGQLVSGRVTQTFRNDVTFVLDLFGLTVTPGHATLCGDGTFTGQHVPIIDILRTDGALVHEDGHLVRAATGCEVGSSGDQFIWAVAGPKLADGSINVVQSGRIRLGTRLFTSEGQDVSVQELVEKAGGRVTPDGLLTTGVLQSPQSGMPFHWAFGDALPKAEDYVLQRSGFELKDLYDDLEGQTMGSLLPLPSVGGSTPETSANQLGLMLNRSVGKERLQ